MLSLVRLAGIGPLDDASLSLVDDEGSPRKLVVLFGAHGVGKTSILTAIASTRPGHTVAQLAPASRSGGPTPAFAVAHWTLGDDDPARPHPLCVASPNAALDERDEGALLRRREQTLFDRRAAEGGFVLVTFSGARWFSRTPALITSPERTVMRYDVRASSSFDDAARADLTRETKQVLTYAATAAALSSAERRDIDASIFCGEAEAPLDRFSRLDRSLRRALNVLLAGADCAYLGVDPARLEPIFETHERGAVELDDLPRSARHLAAFGALTARALAAAYPDRAVEDAEGVALIDDAESNLDPALQRALPGLLREALPKVQWILASSSPALTMGCDLTSVVALRRESTSGRVEIHQGPSAVVH